MIRAAQAMHRMVVAKLRAEWLGHCGVQFSAGIAQEKLSNEKAMGGMAQPRQCKEMLRKSIAEWSLGVDTCGKALAKHGAAQARHSSEKPGHSIGPKSREMEMH